MRNLGPRRAGALETQPGENRGWASAAQARNAPGVGRAGSPGTRAALASAEVREDLGGSAWSRTWRAPWGPRCPGDCAVMGGPSGPCTLVKALPTASPARMCARRGNLFPPQITFFFFFQVKKLLFREVKGLLL